MVRDLRSAFANFFVPIALTVVFWCSNSIRIFTTTCTTTVHPRSKHCRSHRRGVSEHFCGTFLSKQDVALFCAKKNFKTQTLTLNNESVLSEIILTRGSSTSNVDTINFLVKPLYCTTNSRANCLFSLSPPNRNNVFY